VGQVADASRAGGGGPRHPSDRPRLRMRDFLLVVQSTAGAVTIDQEHVHAARPGVRATEQGGSVSSMTAPLSPPPDLDGLRRTSGAIADVVGTVIEGKSEVVRVALTVLLAEGHLLIEDVPGVGKTMLAKALARALDCTVRRVQFTPDLLPSDITGVSVYNQDRRDFEFKPGAIFANVVLGDEINRASPKTQSALLECMEEGQVTVDGMTYRLETPFIVVATQNPIEMEGTYPLPEAQRDRFMARLSMGYPSPEAELAMLGSHGSASPLDQVKPVATAAEVRGLVAATREVWVSEAVRRYVVSLAEATRSTPDLRLGASPRATLHLLRAARAHAALAGRDHVLPDDVQALAVPVLAHRLLLTSEALMARRSAADIVTAVAERVPVPSPTGA
jgi:MoxR-like ATPase